MVIHKVNNANLAIKWVEASRGISLSISQSGVIICYLESTVLTRLRRHMAGLLPSMIDKIGLSKLSYISLQIIGKI